MYSFYILSPGVHLRALSLYKQRKCAPGQFRSKFKQHQTNQSHIVTIQIYLQSIVTDPLLCDSSAGLYPVDDLQLASIL